MSERVGGGTGCSLADANSMAGTRHRVFRRRCGPAPRTTCRIQHGSDHEGPGKIPEIVEPIRAEVKDDLPINRFVAVDDDVAEAHRLAQTQRQRVVQFARLRQNAKRLAHGLRGRQIRLPGQPVGGNVDTQLNGARQIERQDVLCVDIGAEFCR